MPEDVGIPASCLLAGRRLGQLTPVTLFLKVLLRCPISPPFPQDSLDRAAAALASRKVGFLESPRGKAASPRSKKTHLPSQQLPEQALSNQNIWVPNTGRDPLEMQHQALLQHRLKCLIAKVRRSSREGYSAGRHEPEQVPLQLATPRGAGAGGGGDVPGVALPCSDSTPSAV